ncbi:WD repeat-containing mio [Brachionus plicatilis]|uniref:WD repeat-containing mio n=1 Tax=Brachionus plicatilis TaxID=10195 RepID=A0A3M7T4H5_BRAPC|nr:WD repeat-containing mio [Brachionus plicatilis]
MSTGSTNEIKIKWSPLVDEDFILVGNSVNFYRLTSIDNTFKNRNENNIFVSESTCARLIGSINGNSKQKMISWHPFSNPYMIALFENDSSQIRIIRMFDHEERPTIPLLNVGTSRKCNQIEWNPTKSSYLGLGFDKTENSSSICIWDLGGVSINPAYQLDETGTCFSFSWNFQMSDILFASFENRLSIFDLRVSCKPIESLKTDYIHGFSIDPINSFKAASFNQNKIALWDLRKVRDYKEPVDFIEESKPIKSIQFCPSKSNRLAVLSENSSNVNVYRLEEGNDTLIKEQIQYYKHNKSSINSFSWHSKDCNKLMATCTDPNALKLVDLIVAEYSPIGISFNETLNFAVGDKVWTIQSEKIDEELDIGEKIKKRAINFYGIKSFLKNISLLSDDKSELEIKFVWQWLDTSNKIEQAYFEKFSGIKAIFSTPPPENFADDFNKIKREYILKLCGWNNWSETVTELESQGEFERAACIAMFNNRLEKSIEILRNASYKKNSNEYLALTLSLIINRKSLSQKESSKILDKISNPYLKALFAYKNDPDYNANFSIYNDPNIKLPDRVCIAMSMLKNELSSYLKNLTSSFVKDGNLYGILLTGLNFDCIDLFQFYINRTSDVQTPAVAIINSNCAKILANKYVNDWIESYRNLLDIWMLWEQRAHFDIKIGKPQDPKVFIRCLSCGNNLSTRRRTRVQPLEQFANNGIACQQCQKPSLRCSVCQLYMTVDPPKSAFLGNKNKMTYWFLFCQKCSHGGHLGHLEGWFSTNPECPVMSCNCQCYVKEDFFEVF